MRRLIVILLTFACYFTVDAQTVFATKPYLQNPTDGGITISWITNVPTYSWVEYGSDTVNTKIARTIIDGQVLCNNKIHKIRLSDVVPGERYYYRVCSKETKEYGAYNKKFGDTESSFFSSFTVPQKDESEFTALIFNDLHKNSKTLSALCENLKNIKYDFVVFNGDCIDDPQNENQAVGFLKELTETVKADNVPVFFIRGNHEIRGAYSIGLRDLFDYVGDKTYSAFSWGDTRFVQLDLGEDKPDSHPVYYDLNDFTSLRNSQIEFLNSELSSKVFKKADKRVLIHHIPIYGNGDEYQPCYELWDPLLQRANFNICINAHTHEFKYYEKNEINNNPFPVVVGGGYDMEGATMMILSKRGGVMTLKVMNTKGEVLKETEL